MLTYVYLWGKYSRTRYRQPNLILTFRTLNGGLG
jgi:hypothetical protein